MLQRIFFISSSIFGCSILIIALVILSNPHQDWDSLFLANTRVEIRSVQPDCLVIQETERTDVTNFNVENRCGSDIVFNGTTYRDPREPRLTPEQELESELAGREYDFFIHSHMFEFRRAWDVRGKIGIQDFVIHGVTKMTPLGITVKILLAVLRILIPLSFLIAAPLAIANGFRMLRKRR